MLKIKREMKVIFIGQTCSAPTYTNNPCIFFKKSINNCSANATRRTGYHYRLITKVHCHNYIIIAVRKLNENINDTPLTVCHL